MGLERKERVGEDGKGKLERSDKEGDEEAEKERSVVRRRRKT